MIFAGSAPARRLPSLVAGLFLASLGAESILAQEAPRNGDLLLLRHYRVEGCQPIPTGTEVFGWLARKALGIDRFVSTSADCGLTNRRGSREGWNYVFWSDRQDTAASRLIQKAIARFGLTALVPRATGESWKEPSVGPYEPFVLIQLEGEFPIRLWAHGTASLEVEVLPAEGGGFDLTASSKTPDGKGCTATRRVQPGEVAQDGRRAQLCAST